MKLSSGQKRAMDNIRENVKLCAAVSARDAETVLAIADEAMAGLENLEAEVRGVLDVMPEHYRITCCEGGSMKNLGMTLAASVANERRAREEAFKTYYDKFAAAVDACLFMQDPEEQQQLGLKLNDSITTDGVRALKAQRDRLKEEIARLTANQHTTNETRPQYKP